VLGFWTVWVWSHDQEKTRLQQKEADGKARYERLVEAQAPFKKRKFELYMETAEVAGKLVSLERSNPEWEAAYSRFWAMQFSVLATVKDPSVSAAMNAFAEELRTYKHAPDTGKIDITRGASQQLAASIKQAIQDDWPTANQ
jgi:hypothetical protein